HRVRRVSVRLGPAVGAPGDLAVAEEPDQRVLQRIPVGDHTGGQRQHARRLVDQPTDVGERNPRIPAPTPAYRFQKVGRGHRGGRVDQEVVDRAGRRRMDLHGEDVDRAQGEARGQYREKTRPIVDRRANSPEGHATTPLSEASSTAAVAPTSWASRSTSERWNGGSARATTSISPSRWNGATARCVPSAAVTARGRSGAMSIDGRTTGAHQLEAITISSEAPPPAHAALSRSAAAQSAPNSAGVASTTVARPVAGLAATCPTRATSRPGSDTSVPRH